MNRESGPGRGKVPFGRLNTQEKQQELALEKWVKFSTLSAQLAVPDNDPRRTEINQIKIALSKTEDTKLFSMYDVLAAGSISDPIEAGAIVEMIRDRKLIQRPG